MSFVPKRVWLKPCPPTIQSKLLSAISSARRNQSGLTFRKLYFILLGNFNAPRDLFFFKDRPVKYCFLGELVVRIKEKLSLSFVKNYF